MQPLTQIGNTFIVAAGTRGLSSWTSMPRTRVYYTNHL